MPDFKLEKAHGGLVAGVDEVGRGPLAGPVVAAAVVLDLKRTPKALLRRIDDSKKLAAAEREAVAAELRTLMRAGIISASLGMARVAEIDDINILWASMLAMERAVDGLRQLPDLVLVDGNRLPRKLPCAGQTVVGGDALSLSIAAASILAKVARDRAMTRLSVRYPGYGFERNAGYGTPEHLAALNQLGVCSIHRTTFAPVRTLLMVKDNIAP